MFLFNEIISNSRYLKFRFNETAAYEQKPLSLFIVISL